MFGSRTIPAFTSVIHVKAVFQPVRIDPAAAAAPFHAIPPAPAVCLGMAILLLVTLGAKNFRLSAAAGTLFLILLCSFPLRSLTMPARVTVFSADSASPPAVVIMEKTGVTVVNPVLRHLDETEKLLRHSGVSAVEEVQFSGSSVKNLSGLERLARHFPVERLILPPRARGDAAFRERLSETPGAYRCAPQAAGAGKIRIFRKNSDFAIDYPDSGVMLSWRLEIRSGDRGRILTFSRKGVPPVTALLPWSNKSGVWQHEL